MKLGRRVFRIRPRFYPPFLSPLSIFITGCLFCSVLLIFSCRTLFTSIEEEKNLSSIHTWVYQVQNVEIPALENSSYDLVVIDYSRDGTEYGMWSIREIDQLKKSGNGKIVLAYLSLGEAESYRWYWESGWISGNPFWLGQENPEWPENYKVQYWDDKWKNIVKEYLTKIINQGFDGVYLDGIDSYEYWSDPFNRESLSLLVTEAADRMVSLVVELGEYARIQSGKSDFILCTQNGTGICQDATNRSSFLNGIDAVAAEDVFYPGEEAMDNPYNPQKEVLEDLSYFRREGKQVVSVEYLSQTNVTAIEQYYQTARKYGFIPYAANRDLDTLRLER
ncbi:MAG TPA: endo alpha-1,4 polygalactosaminidase [Spirochaetales bacterium]|nr:endo alpha-1,4 polygalactosaminidase [Spirochaetales bacterium]